MPQPSPSALLPKTHPSLTLHLTDSTTHPIVYSSPTSSPIPPTTLNALSAALQTAHETSSRLGLGGLRRVTLHTTSPSETKARGGGGGERGGACILQARIVADGAEKAVVEEGGEEEEEGPEAAEPPVLLATVVAPRGEVVGEARRSLEELVRVGRGVQGEWRLEVRGSSSVGSVGSKRGGTGGGSLGSVD